eukprot:g12077.t1 g12077   contig6:1169076-1169864(+)
MALRSQSIRIARALNELSTSVSISRRACSTSVWTLHAHRSAAVAPSSVGSNHQWSGDGMSRLRRFSSKPEEATTEGDTPKSEEETASTDEEAASASSSAADDTTNKLADLEKQVKDLKDNLLRSLAEQENTRRIAKRDVDQARSFAISSFAKSLLDTSDNLSRALDAVPEELRHDHENHPVLANLYEGISMTDEGLTKAFAKNGLKKFGVPGEKFDPNKHEALFEYPDPNGEAGNIGQVMKVGFMLNDRVVRPAEVGVVKAA